jgi:hypothetical protein
MFLTVWWNVRGKGTPGGGGSSFYVSTGETNSFLLGDYDILTDPRWKDGLVVERGLDPVHERIDVFCCRSKYTPQPQPLIRQMSTSGKTDLGRTSLSVSCT